MKSIFAFAIILLMISCKSYHKLHFEPAHLAIDSNTTAEQPVNNKLIIYQLMTRLFANENTTNQKWGTIAQNGVSTFNDINNLALQSLKQLGITHVWYTGIIEHATMADHSEAGIALDDADFIKGRAGSPYAIKDYYDVNPDLAANKNNRMQEFESLIARTHQNELKVIIDFVPNHVARNYKSDAKPANISDLGAADNNMIPFSANNNFYYLPNKKFQLPKNSSQPPIDLKARLDGQFFEYPAKVTGNNVFSEAPKEWDWFETIKLNYGVDYANNEKKYWDTIPKTWKQMTHILLFWAQKGVDGFRCDMAEMVPVEFWQYAITQVKKQYPHCVFIAEIYNQSLYQSYINQGGFDYLYDKSGLYDRLRAIATHQEKTDKLYSVWHHDLNNMSNHMLRFIENHDEQRIASKDFLGNALDAKAIMTVAATLYTGPTLIYFGQELGEKADSAEGFGGNDGRTTIFDYWAVPAMQGWINHKKFDGALRSPLQKEVRSFYATLLNFCKTNPAINQGAFYHLPTTSENKGTSMAYMRLASQEQVLVVANFDAKPQKINFAFSQNLKKALGINGEENWILKELFTNQKITISSEANSIEVPACSAFVLPFN